MLCRERQSLESSRGSREGDPSSSQKPILFLELSVPRDGPSSWIENSGWSCSEQKQSSRPSFQMLEKPFQKRIARTSIPPKYQPSPLWWLRGMVLHSSWVLAKCSSCNRLHSLFAWAKSSRWMSGCWGPSLPNVRIQCFELWFLSTLVAT